MNSSQPLAGVILAAGKGTRMRGEQPKCLYAVCGIPMAAHIGRAMKALGISHPILVVGHGADAMTLAFGSEYTYVRQETQEGTGHAVMQAMPKLVDFNGPVLVTPGDTPLLDEGALRELVDTHHAQGAAVTVATFHLPDAGSYGRLVRDTEGNPVGIVEAKDCTPEQRKITEINSAVYCMDAEVLRKYLPRLDKNNRQNEYYLTDVVRLAAQDGLKIAAQVFPDDTIFGGVNDRFQLAQVAEVMRRRILERHCKNGVTIIDLNTTFIEPDVQIEPDAQIEPLTILKGHTTIGTGTIIGPDTTVQDAQIGRECVVLRSHLNRCVVGDGTKIGPFAHIRPGSDLGNNVKIGNFVETKKSTLADGVSASHLSYIGDAEVGERTNIGAGTITCNYDGFAKHRTTIGRDVFVGSNSTLVAPIKLGDRSFVAAGSVITRNLADGSLGIGRSRTDEKVGWADSWREMRKGPKS